ncbi:MAG: hypothetical protein PHX05_00075 [Acidobacteriota bacterium]|nr:hypothetical protein [Acidobacteriota bacterium]
MSWLDGLPGIGKMFETTRDILRGIFGDKAEADKAAAEITLRFADVIQAELGGRYWLAGNWRAIVMLLIAAGLLVKSVLGTAFDASADYVLFTLLVMGLLGYKLDGKILEFVALMFKFGTQQQQEKEGKKHV